MGCNGAAIDGCAGGVENGISDGRCAGTGGRFAQRFGAVGTGGLGIFHEMCFQMGMIHKGGELIVQQIVIQGFAGFGIELQFLGKSEANGHGHTAVHLRFCQLRVD